MPGGVRMSPRLEVVRKDYRLAVTARITDDQVSSFPILNLEARICTIRSRSIGEGSIIGGGLPDKAVCFYEDIECTVEDGGVGDKFIAT